jgi:hypothetical protein
LPELRVLMNWDHDQTAHKVGDAVAEAWYAHGHDTRGYDSVALSVVAALMLTGAGPGKTDPGRQLAVQSDDFIARMLAEIWGTWAASRPDLAYLCGHLGEWLYPEPTRENTRGAAAVARAAVKAGLLRIAHDGEARLAVDVLGPAYMASKTKNAKSARGEFYTPPNLCTMMAQMVLGGATPGQSICEPCSGTGGMFRGAAEALRSQGLDPADFVWVGADINPVAVACLAVNCSVWRLGPNVLIGVADTLAEKDFEVRFAADRRAAIGEAGSLLKQARMLAAFNALFTPPPGPDEPEPPAALPCPKPALADLEPDTLF